MQTRYKIIISGSLLLLAFAAGRYLTPEKVKIEKQIVEVEKKSKETETEKHKQTTVVEVTKPDGTKEVTTTITEDSGKKTVEKDKLSKDESSSTEVVRSSSRVSLAALAGTDLHSLHALVPVYGASINKEILGPISVGAWGLSNGTAGISLGLNF